MKVLLPYIRTHIYGDDSIIIYVRTDLYGNKYWLYGNAAVYVYEHRYISNLAGSIANLFITDKWRISYGDITEKTLPRFSTLEEAKDELDQMLIEEGYTLLNSEDEAAKYKLLM